MAARWGGEKWRGLGDGARRSALEELGLGLAVHVGVDYIPVCESGAVLRVKIM